MPFLESTCQGLDAFLDSLRVALSYWNDDKAPPLAASAVGLGATTLIIVVVLQLFLFLYRWIWKTQY